MRNRLEDGTEKPIVGSIGDAGWIGYSLSGPEVWKADAAQLGITGGSGKPGKEANLDWAITKRIDPKAMQPDNGIAIKELSTPALKKYYYIYNSLGTYEATFVASNANVEDTKTVIRKVPVTITKP